MQRRAAAAGVATAVLLALGAAACGGGGASGDGGGRGAAGASVPVVGCSTEHGMDDTLDGVPKGLPATRAVPGLEAGRAGDLAWYEGDTSQIHELAVLAPRGWACEATIAVNGSWGLRAYPEHAEEEADTSWVGVSGQYGMPGAEAACSLFPEAAQGLDDTRYCTPPDGAEETARSEHAVRYTLAPSGDSGGSLNLLVWFEDAGQAAVAATCSLDDGTLCEPVLDEAEARLLPLVEAEVSLSGSG